MPSPRGQSMRDPEFLRLTPAPHIIHRLARNLRELTTIVSSHCLYVGHRNKGPDRPVTQPGVLHAEHMRNISRQQPYRDHDLMVVWLHNHWTSCRCRQRLTNFLNILHRHRPGIVRRLNRLILPTSNPTCPSLRPHSNVRLEVLRGDRIQVERGGRC